MADSKIQWHPGFYAGMEVEFRSYQVTMQQEFQLTRGPLSIDLLIIKKLTDEKIDNQIGNIFRRHNIVEFKSPDDELSIDVFYKTQAYACLYKASGESVNEIPDDEITVTLCRDSNPKELFHQLSVSGFEIAKAFPGVYYLSGKGLFPTQIIVSGELESDDHAVLRILSNHAKEEDIRTFLMKTLDYTEQGDRARADAILQVSASANISLYQKIYKEEPSMCQALYEIMKDDIDQRVQQGMQQGMQQGAAQKAAEVYQRLRAANMPESQAHYMAYGTPLPENHVRGI
jgi:hypothetical protein